MGDAAQLSGPDLKAGVPLTDLEDDKPFLGHADGEAVLLGVDGRSDFNGLHSRQHDKEVQFYAFDMLVNSTRSQARAAWNAVAGHRSACGYR